MNEVSSFPPFAQILRGSLLERRTFHSSGCSQCAEGAGHPQWIVTVTYPRGTTEQVSVTAGQLPQIRDWIINCRRIKDTLEAISEINLDLRSARDAGKAPSSGSACQRGRS